MFKLVAHTMPTIGKLHQPPLDVDRLRQLDKSMPLADQNETVNGQAIDILVGNNYYSDLVMAERIQVAKGLYLIGSKLGWLVSGRLNDRTIWENKPAMMVMTAMAVMTPTGTEPYVEADQPLLNDIHPIDFWSLESIGIKDCPYENDDDIALQQFNNTVQYESQWYQVTWPRKENFQGL